MGWSLPLGTQSPGVSHQSATVGRGGRRRHLGVGPNAHGLGGGREEPAAAPTGSPSHRRGSTCLLSCLTPGGQASQVVGRGGRGPDCWDLGRRAQEVIPLHCLPPLQPHVPETHEIESRAQQKGSGFRAGNAGKTLGLSPRIASSMPGPTSPKQSEGLIWGQEESGSWPWSRASGRAECPRGGARELPNDLGAVVGGRVAQPDPSGF